MNPPPLPSAPAGDEWFADPAFWRLVEPLAFDPARLDSGPSEAAAMLRLCGAQAGQSWLDLCCGPGRHALALARWGYRVTAVDLCEAYLAKARAAAEEAGVSIDWQREDCRRFLQPGRFDGICCLFTSFGYFANEQDHQLVLDNQYQNLKPGGCLLLEVFSTDVENRLFQPHSEYRLEGDRVEEQKDFDRQTSRLRLRWHFRRSGRSCELSYRCYTTEEIETRLRQAGFGSVRFYGDLDGRPFGSDSLHLYALARK